VRNAVDLNATTRFILVSGSNMSGKSTYLRSIGLNTVLAQAGAPVCAESVRLSHFQLASSMRIQDSLQEGKSRFFAEVSRVRAILDLAERGPVLFLLDELLSGTNSQDRRDGVAGVIDHLIAHRASGLLTTHDLALTGIVAHHGNAATNVHFTDSFEDGKMSFDYKLRPGIVNRANAREILGLLGIPVHALRSSRTDGDRNLV
jgi:DNA mismatch repair ATPase MutS